MQENENNVEKIINLINSQIKDFLEFFLFEINEKLSILEIEIVKQMQIVGIYDEEKPKNKMLKNNNNKEEKLAIGSKILIGVSIGVLVIIGSPFITGYELFYTLPNYIINKFNDKRKFDIYISEKKKELENKMIFYEDLVNSKINSYKKLTLEKGKRLLGLLEANSIEVDEIWEDAKKEYLNIYNDYKNIKNLK